MISTVEAAEQHECKVSRTCHVPTVSAVAHPRREMPAGRSRRYLLSLAARRLSECPARYSRRDREFVAAARFGQPMGSSPGQTRRILHFDPYIFDPTHAGAPLHIVVA